MYKSNKMKSALPILCAALLALTGCASSGGDLFGPPSGSDVQNSSVKTAKADGEPAVNIKLAEWESIEWDSYSDVYVTIKIPKGWEVVNTSDGVFLEYSVRSPDHHIGWHYSEKEHTALHSQAWLDEIRRQNNDPDRDEIIMEEGTAKCYYEQMWSRVDGVTEFTVTDVVNHGQSELDKQRKDQGYTDDIAKETDNSTVYADFVQDGFEGSGMYYAIVTQYMADKPLETWDFDNVSRLVSEGEQYFDAMEKSKVTIDCSSFSMYGVNWFYSPRGEIDNWKDVLEESIKSTDRTQKYWDDFFEYWNAVLKAQNQAFNNVNQIQQEYSSSFSTYSDSMMDSYEERSRSEDIIAQKRSDVTLGYERVYDTQTGEIYKAYSGFTEDYQKLDGQRYAPCTDDMYTQGYSGWIDSMEGFYH